MLFPAFGPSQALILSFATYAVGFIARPIGGLFFGVMGDRLGRKWVLMITILLMGLSSLFVGLLPTAATIGVWAPIMLCSCGCARASAREPSRPGPPC